MSPLALPILSNPTAAPAKSSRLSVVLSQAQGRNPAKRSLEEAIAAELLMDPSVELHLVPHLYDLHADHPALLSLRGVAGDLVVLSWLFPRAAYWTLDRQAVRGRLGETELGDADEEDEPADAPRPGGIGHQGPTPDRTVSCLDLRVSPDPAAYLAEVRRIAGGDSAGHRSPPTTLPPTAAPLDHTAADTKRRWYPVIDYGRCTNCMECIDFCLFGVYGVDAGGSVFVEQQDSCKKGCPACSRVCPANAIVFPGHKTPAIAGADGVDDGVTGLKVDLSKLFGAPDKDPLELAAAERDVELLKDGREAVGLEPAVKKQRVPDQWDALLDGLDALGL